MDKDIEPAPFLWIEEGKEEVYTPRMRRRTKKKKEFVGWGSRQLIEFLESVGRETCKALSQHEVTEIIIKYINENRLIHPDKKKKVMCDERLHALFGRKSVNRVKIYDLLEAHLAEHQVDSDDDLFCSSEEKEEEFGCKRQRVASSDRKPQSKKKVPEVSRTSLAAISPENIKLVYLKRTLVQELLKHPETFEGKVVGSFVRIKSDPLDILQKNSHQLQLVTGVKEVFAAGADCSCTLLQISGMTHEVSITALSDDNFSEEECEDLHKRVQDSLIKQPTVGELEQKVGVLHEDITKHWLTRELALLKNLIDRANEKGWRYRVMEYLDKRRLLQTPSEQSRLLSEIPKVSAEVKAETVPEDPQEDVNQNIEDSPKANDWDWEPYYDLPAKGVMTKVSREEAWQAEVEIGTRSNGHSHSSSLKEGALPEAEGRAESNGHTDSFVRKERYFPETEAIGLESNGHSKSLIPDQRNFPRTEESREENNGRSQVQRLDEREVLGMETGNVKSNQVEVIDLSDDDDDDQKQKVPANRKQIPDPLPELLMWHYFDPQGNVQGPFSLSSLKRWRDANFFPPSFRVWRNGESPHEAALLNDIIHEIFPN